MKKFPCFSIFFPSPEKIFSCLENFFSSVEKTFSSVGKIFSRLGDFFENRSGQFTPIPVAANCVEWGRPAMRHEAAPATESTMLPQGVAGGLPLAEV
ncbi:MAG: hypothetical protein MR446_05250, partial [Bacteroidales bacterium]|nr:hypothetical protein [Bacteroidales bacterium]